MDPKINIKIVSQAVRFLKQQYELTLQPTFDTCTGVFKKSMGIPCSHTIRDLIRLNLKLSAAHFDTFWLYIQPDPAPQRNPTRFGMLDLCNITPLLPNPASLKPPPPAVLPPLKIRTKSRPRKNDTSTKRNPSGWERNGASGVCSTPKINSKGINSTSRRTIHHDPPTKSP